MEEQKSDEKVKPAEVEVLKPKELNTMLLKPLIPGFEKMTPLWYV
jgi:hypothetical protein